MSNTPTLVLVGKIGPAFGPLARVQTNGRIFRMRRANERALFLALRAAEQNFTAAVTL